MHSVTTRPDRTLTQESVMNRDTRRKRIVPLTRCFRCPLKEPAPATKDIPRKVRTQAGTPLGSPLDDLGLDPMTIALLA